MGANAQTTVPTFVASQVLTADQMNQSARTGIPVFATTVTRDAGFGGTGEKTLAEGQLCYVEGTGLQSYNGTSWVTWGTAPSSGLAVVKAQTSFSAATSVTADNIFTSSYTNYRINLRIKTSTTQNAGFRLRASASSAATNYNYQISEAGSTTVTASLSTSQTSFLLPRTNDVYAYAIIDLANPQLAEPTLITMIHNGLLTNYTALELRMFTGNHNTATAYDGIEFFVGSGTTTGEYTVYGWGKS